MNLSNPPVYVSSSCPLLRETHIPRVFEVGVYLIISSLSSAHLRTPLLRGTRIPRLFSFWSLLSYLLAFCRPSLCLPLLRGTHISWLFRFRSLSSYLLAFSRTSSSRWNLHPLAIWVLEFIYISSEGSKIVFLSPHGA